MRLYKTSESVITNTNDLHNKTYIEIGNKKSIKSMREFADKEAWIAEEENVIIDATRNTKGGKEEGRGAGNVECQPIVVEYLFYTNRCEVSRPG